MDTAKKIMWRCGQGTPRRRTQSGESRAVPQAPSFRDGSAYGRFASERIWKTNLKTGKNEINAWRAADAGYDVQGSCHRKSRIRSLRATEAIRLLSAAEEQEVIVTSRSTRRTSTVTSKLSKANHVKPSPKKNWSFTIYILRQTSSTMDTR